jgi:hypothetical protein
MSYNISHQTNILDVEKIFEKMAPDVHKNKQYAFSFQ